MRQRLGDGDVVVVDPDAGERGAAAALAGESSILRTVSYSSILSSTASPASTISSGYGCSMMNGIPFGVQPFVG